MSAIGALFNFAKILGRSQEDSIIEKVTDAMVAVEGEGMRPVTWVKIHEVEQGDWAIGGQRINAAGVHAMNAK